MGGLRAAVGRAPWGTSVNGKHAYSCRLAVMSFLRNYSRISIASAGPFLFAWGAWLLTAVCVLRFVGTHAINLPHYDEWEVVPAITGNQPITLKWLWSQHNEHRIVIGRLLYIAIARLSGSDFRAGMFFNAFTLIAAAGLLLERARRLRGVNYTDAFLPLVILNLGQAQNLIWSFQICFVSAAAMAILVLSLVVARGVLTFPRALAIASCTAALPLAAGPGLGLTPPLVVCSFVMAWELRNASKGRLKAAAVALLGILAVLVSVLYFVDYQRPAKHPPSRVLSLVCDAMVQFLLSGFGSGAHALWPSPGKWIFWALTLSTLGALIFVFARIPSERYRVVRVALFLAALGSLALGISWARSSFVSLFESRYVTLAAP